MRLDVTASFTNKNTDFFYEKHFILLETDLLYFTIDLRHYKLNSMFWKLTVAETRHMVKDTIFDMSYHES